MPDISMCPGGACPLKERCYRYTATPSSYQSFMVDPPFQGDDCKYYWKDTNYKEKKKCVGKPKVK